MSASTVSNVVHSDGWSCNCHYIHDSCIYSLQFIITSSIILQEEKEKEYFSFFP